MAGVCDPAFAAYLEDLMPPRAGELAAMEAYAREHRFPIVGPAVGRLFYLLARATRARRIFELGSGYGYSTAWFAMAVRDNGGGEVHHVVWDETLSRSARGHLERLSLLPVVRFHVSEAVGALRSADGLFDIIFSDIDKNGYVESLPVIKSRLAPAGLLLVDNMYWRGRVVDARVTDRDTQAIRTFTRAVFGDPDFDATIVPLRDGVLLARRRDGGGGR